jgi:ADP-ribosyl-[dinitrogen reductase] hydrolase
MDGGNGAVMRMTPIALGSFGDSRLLARWALEQAHITHNHVHSDAACLLVGQILQLALAGHGKERLLALVRRFVTVYPQFAYEGKQPFCSAYVVDTIRTVLHAFFSTKTLEDCIVTTVNLGGDADTAGAIAGAIAGAYYGPSEIPKRWAKRLDAAVTNEVTQLARKLVAQCPMARGQGTPYLERELLPLPQSGAARDIGLALAV